MNTNDDDVLELSGIHGQPLSSLTCQWHICDACKIVDFGIDRIKHGYPCPRCGVPGRGGHMYFFSHHLTLVDLMQDLFHARTPDGRDLEGNERSLAGQHRFAVIIFFCTLWETLLQNFLEECMDNKALPGEIQERLLLDHQADSRRRDILFPLLTGTKWNDALQRLSSECAYDHRPVFEFYTVLAKERNQLLHRGHVYSVPKERPRECLLHLHSCLQLFVDLHNAFVVESLPEASPAPA